MNIREVMTPNPRTVSPQDSIQSAARIMRDEDTGAVPVVENGRPIGMVTDRDIVVRAVADGRQRQPTGSGHRHDWRGVRDAGHVDARSQRTDERTSSAPTAGGRKRPAGRHRVAWRPGGEGGQGSPYRRHAAGHFRRRQRARLSNGSSRPSAQAATSASRISTTTATSGTRDRPRLLEQRDVVRRLDPRFRRRIAAAVADQRLVGDGGAAMSTFHRGLRAPGFRLQAGHVTSQGRRSDRVTSVTLARSRVVIVLSTSPEPAP